jgi:hypothetical protein
MCRSKRRYQRLRFGGNLIEGGTIFLFQQEEKIELRYFSVCWMSETYEGLIHPTTDQTQAFTPPQFTNTFPIRFLLSNWPLHSKSGIFRHFVEYGANWDFIKHALISVGEEGEAKDIVEGNAL